MRSVWKASQLGLVEVCADEEVATGVTDEFAAAILQAGGAGGAVDGVVLRRKIAGGWFCDGLGQVVGNTWLHRDRVTQVHLF